ncbi:MAG: transglycosylase domain-containing protein [Myxococcota bacterium]|nr:transglycosylase domain-containing protein [Myxococcota bacterium]
MRVHIGRWQLIASGALAGVAVVMAICVGPLVRTRVAAEAARRHLEANIGAVRLGWFALRLEAVDIQAQGFTSMRARIDEVRVSLSALMKVRQVELRGGLVTLTGSPDSLRDDWHKWRDHRGVPEHSDRSTALKLTGLSVSWVDTQSPAMSANLYGIGVLRDGQGTQLTVTDGHARFGRAGIDLGQATADFDARGMLVRAHVGSLTVGWTANPEPSRPDLAAPGNGSPPNALPPVVIARSAHNNRRGRPQSPLPADAGAPLVSLPDLRAARAVTAAIASTLAAQIQQGAGVWVDALTWRITDDPERVALTLGPGPLALDRTAARLELTYSAEKNVASTPLALRILLPTDGGDVITTVEGGPISLSMLGVMEGAAGLVDVGQATVAGRARVVLAGDGSALTFDTDAGTRSLSVNHRKLAVETVRGLDLALRARGTLTATGELRLDDFDATLGALHVAGSGMLDQKPDRVVATARLEISHATCQSLLDSIPDALLPTIQRTKIDGTFGGVGRFAFDTRSPDELELSYDIRDGCRLIDVPSAMDRDRFMKAFAYRIYLPDGSTTEITTGPATPNWTPLDHISPYMQTAVLTTEDGAFPKHHGYNHAAIRASIVANLKARRFVRGASTITMQLAKNLFLSRDKTLSRKLEEVVLTDYLEQTFSKDEIMELYLNVIEFGPAVYGITAAAEYYFGRSPAELDLAECLFLASLLPSPVRYATMRDREQPPEGWMRSIHGLMEVARKRGLLTDAELSDGESEEVVFWHGGDRPPPRAAVRARTPVGGDDADIADPFEAGE